MPSPTLLQKTCPSNSDIGTKSPSRKSRLQYDFPIETLIALSQFRQDEAAKILGVASITLKRNCQRQKYRWPYRTIKAQRRREARLAGQKTHVEKPFAYASLPSPQLLLSLKTVAQHSNSLSSITCQEESLVISKSTTQPQFSLVQESKMPTLPALPPLRSLLQNLKLQSVPATPPHLNTVRSMQHHPIEHKNSYYSASIYPAGPICSVRSLSDCCQSQERLLSSGFMYTRYKNQ